MTNNILNVNEIICYGEKLPTDVNGNNVYQLRYWTAIVNGVKAVSYNTKTGASHEWQIDKRIGKPQIYVRMVNGIPRITKPYIWDKD
jgi:hypothetical protein